MIPVRQRRMTDPTPWATDPTKLMSDPTGGKRNGAIGPIRIASTAANESAQAETDGGDIVAMPIERPPTASEITPRETPTNTKRHTAAALCEQCGAEFTPKRPHGRYCGPYCRRLAWLARNPQKAAELAERDRARLRDHIIANGGEWIERRA